MGNRYLWYWDDINCHGQGLDRYKFMQVHPFLSKSQLQYWSNCIAFLHNNDHPSHLCFILDNVRLETTPGAGTYLNPLLGSVSFNIYVSSSSILLCSSTQGWALAQHIMLRAITLRGQPHVQESPWSILWTSLLGKMTIINGEDSMYQVGEEGNVVVLSMTWGNSNVLLLSICQIWSFAPVVTTIIYQYMVAA